MSITRPMSFVFLNASPPVISEIESARELAAAGQAVGHQRVDAGVGARRGPDGVHPVAPDEAAAPGRRLDDVADGRDPDAHERLAAMFDGLERPRHLGHRAQGVLDRLAAKERQRVRPVFGDPEQRLQPIAERLVAAVVQAHDAELVRRGHARDEHARDRLNRQRVAGADAAVVEQQHDGALGTPAAGDVGHGIERLQFDGAAVLLDLKVLLLQAGHRPVVVIEDHDVQLDEVLRLLLRRDDRRGDRAQHERGHRDLPPHQSPITFTTTRFLRRPSNSA